MKRAEDVRKQISQIMDRFHLPIVSTSKSLNQQAYYTTSGMAKKDFAKIRKTITAGFFFNVCRKDQQEGYKTVSDNQQVFIHPSSALGTK